MTRARATRRFATLCGAVLVLSACGRPAEIATPSGTGSAAATHEPVNSGSPTASLGSRTGQPGPGVVPTASPQREEAQNGPAPVAPDDEGPVGANAIPYLRKESSKLVVEINAVSGKQPRESALTLLRTRLAAVLDKPDGIDVLPTRTFASTKSSYSTDQILEVEKAQRRRYSDPKAGQAVVHVLYLNGHVRDADGALGLAYRASSVVMLPDQIDAASNPLLTAEEIEQAALVHEAGHLLGLVNIGYTSPRDHEDPSHRGHSRNRRSVMYWAIETLDVANILSGNLPTSFDSDDLADLEDRKAGKI